MTYSCIADSSYALMLYLLYASEEMLANTTYYVGKNLACVNLPNQVYMPQIEPYTNLELIKYRLSCLQYRPKLRKSVVFAQDHLPFSAPLIDNLPYIVIEDCPNFFSIREDRNEITFKPTIRNLWYNFKVGRIYQRYAGNNPWCKKRIITSNRDKVLFQRKGLQFEQVSLDGLWKSSSDYKKRFILDIFDLPKLDQIEKNVVIFSQPLMEDAGFSCQEVIDVFKTYVAQYGVENILVKMHPRDTFDYIKAFPGISSLKSKAPQQLLDLLGVKFKKAITICSSAVSSMPQDCEIIWLGTEIDARIVKAYGHINNPRA